MRVVVVAVALLGGVIQDEDGQRSTALLRIYPNLEAFTARASQLAREGRYAQALEIYTEAWNRYPDHVVPRDGGLGIGVRRFVVEQIAAWPDAGKEAYRRRYDPPARELFERAKRNRSLALLDRLIAEYPFSSAVRDARVLGANLLLDRGRAEEAARTLGPIQADPVLAARLGLAYSTAGMRGDLERLRERAERKWPRDRIRAGSRDVLLVDYLRELLDRTSTRPRRAETASLPGWEMMGGDPSATRTAEKGIPLGAPAWRVDLPLPVFEYAPRTDFRRRAYSSLSDYLPIFPAVSDGVVYVHNEYGILAVNLFARGADLLWSHHLRPPAGLLMFEDRLIHSTSVHRGRVFANLVTDLGDAEEQLGYVRVKYPFPKRALLALDAYTGERLWRVGGEGDGATLAKGASFATAPTPEEDRLYVGAVVQRHSTDPFDHYVVCLNARSGAILWSTFVASGLTEINLFGNSTRESLGTPVSIRGEILYYGTNHGAFAALEKGSGRLQWVFRYAQLPIRPTRSVHVQRNPLEWGNAPPVIGDDVVYFAPTDSRRLYALDRRTGEVRWRTVRPKGARYVCGLQDRTLVLGGEEVYLYDALSGRLRQRLQPRRPARGRGVLTEGGLYLPTRDGLVTVRLDPLSEVGIQAWRGGEGGNVVVVDGAVVVAGSHSIQAFFDRRFLEKRAKETAQRDPDDLRSAYASAVRAAQAGDSYGALQLLERVYRRVSSSSEEPLARACRMRLYHLHLVLGREGLRKGRPRDALPHLARAEALAPDPKIRTAIAFLLAQAHESLGDPAQAVRVLYRLLPGGGEALRTRIRRRVDEVARRHGSRSLLALEKEADRKLDSAQRNGTPEALLEVARLYPNCRAAERAILDAAEAQRRMDRREDEAATLRLFLREYPDSVALPQVQLRLILALEAGRQFSAAAGVLTRMARRFPDRWIDADGIRLPIREFVSKRLEKEEYRKARGESRPPRLRPPLRMSLRFRDRRYPEVAPARIEGIRPGTVKDYAFLNFGGALAGLSPGGKTWSMDLSAPLRYAAFHEGDLLVATSKWIRRIDPVSGATRWTVSSGDRILGFERVGNHLCYFVAHDRGGSSSEIVAVDAQRGTRSWRAQTEGYPSSRIRAAGDLALVLTLSPSRLHAFDSETGRKVFSYVPTSGELSLQVFRVAPHQIVLHSPARSLEACALPSGRRLWVIDLTPFEPQILEANGTDIVLVGRKRDSRGAALLARFDRTSGKLSGIREGLALSDPRFALMNDRRLYLFCREDRLEVHALALNDFKTEWVARFPEGPSTLLPPTATEGHLVVPTFDRGETGKFGFSITLLDPAGKAVQNIRSTFAYDRPPNCLVIGGAVVVTGDSEVRVYR